MFSKKEKIIYTLEESIWIEYLYKIEQDRLLLENLLFVENSLPLYIKSLMCEYFSFLYNMEETIDQMADEENYDPELKSFIVTEKLAFQFSLLMKALVISKENIANNNYSISLH